MREFQLVVEMKEKLLQSDLHIKISLLPSLELVEFMDEVQK